MRTAVVNSLGSLFPAFRERVEQIIKEMNRWCDVHRPGASAIVTETFRTRERQMFLYAQGRTKPGKIVTQRNGTTNPSNHQSSLAADFAMKSKHGPIVWNDDAFWDYLGHCARAAGLTWGGDWKSPVDKPHIEWPESDSLTYQRAANWKRAQGLK